MATADIVSTARRIGINTNLQVVVTEIIVVEVALVTATAALVAILVILEVSLVVEGVGEV